MTDTLQLTVKSLFNWNFISNLDRTSLRDATEFASYVNFVDGEDVNECNQLFHDTRTLAGGASEDLNLLALSLSMFGGTITFGFDFVKAILFTNNSTTAGENFKIGGSGSNAFSAPFDNDDDAKLLIPAYGHFCLMNPTLAGWDVGAGAYALRIQNSGSATNTYSIAIAGVLQTS